MQRVEETYDAKRWYRTWAICCWILQVHTRVKTKGGLAGRLRGRDDNDDDEEKSRENAKTWTFRARRGSRERHCVAAFCRTRVDAVNPRDGKERIPQWYTQDTRRGTWNKRRGERTGFVRRGCPRETKRPDVTKLEYKNFYSLLTRANTSARSSLRRRSFGFYRRFLFSFACVKEGKKLEMDEKKKNIRRPVEFGAKN